MKFFKNEEKKSEKKIFSDYLLTKYLYPIEPSDKFWNNIYFDNPRTEKEIDEVANFLKKSNLNDHLSLEEDDLEKDLKDFCEHFEINYNFNSNYDIYHKLASIWVIVRFDYVIRSNDYSLIDSCDSKASRIVNFLSFCNIDNSDRTDNNIFLCSERSIAHCDKTNTAFITFNNLFGFKRLSESSSKNSDMFTLPFPTVENIIYSKINTIINFENDEKFNYIAEQISHIENQRHYQEKLILLVSLFEMLLAHKPNADRYNVEQSIKRSFQNKILLLLYLDNPGNKKDYLKKELSLIYDLRSDIAHGNFDNISDTLEKIRKLYLDNNLIGSDEQRETYAKYLKNKNIKLYAEDVCFLEDFYIYSTIIKHLKKYIKIILNKYVTDMDFFDILKEI